MPSTRRARFRDLTGSDKAAPSKGPLAKTDRLIANAVRKAQVAFGELTIRVIRSSGNEDRPVLVLLAPGFDPKKPAKVQTHYHGDLASVADEDGYTTCAVKDLLSADPQRVFVLPEAK